METIFNEETFYKNDLQHRTALLERSFKISGTSEQKKTYYINQTED